MKQKILDILEQSRGKKHIRKSNSQKLLILPVPQFGNKSINCDLRDLYIQKHHKPRLLLKHIRRYYFKSAIKKTSSA
jgi:hypothetical protein